MAATIAQVRARLAADAAARTFASGFAEGYFAQAFGALPKTEIDLLVFRLLMETGVLQPDQPIYEIARSLNVTPAKARNLLFQHQLRTMSEADIEASVVIAVTTARFSVDGTTIGFGVESPLVRSAIQARSKSKGVFADVSLSGEILHVPMAQIGDFLGAFLPDARRELLIARLRRKKVVSPADLTLALNKVGAAMLQESEKAGGKAAAVHIGRALFDWIGGVLQGSDVDVPGLIGDLL